MTLFHSHDLDLITLIFQLDHAYFIFQLDLVTTYYKNTRLPWSHKTVHFYV